MSNTTTNANGYTFFNKGTLPQLMTQSFILFILLSQTVFGLIQSLIPSFGWVITLVLYIVWFTNDRELLRKNNAFLPSAWWFLFIPVYIYKRQNRNGNSRLWFVWYIVSIPVAFVIVVGVQTALGIPNQY